MPDSSFTQVLPNSAIYILHKDFTSQANVGTGETIIATFQLPINLLNALGVGIRIQMFGIYAANGNGKRIQFFFGATELINNIFNAGSVNNDGGWNVLATIYRTSIGNQIARGNGGKSTTVSYQQAVTTPAEDESQEITIKVVVPSAVASGDVTFKGMIIEVLPNAG